MSSYTSVLGKRSRQIIYKLSWVKFRRDRDQILQDLDEALENVDAMFLAMYDQHMITLTPERMEVLSTKMSEFCSALAASKTLEEMIVHVKELMPYFEELINSLQILPEYFTFTLPGEAHHVLPVNVKEWNTFVEKAGGIKTLIHSVIEDFTVAPTDATATSRPAILRKK